MKLNICWDVPIRLLVNTKTNAGIRQMQMEYLYNALFFVNYSTIESTFVTPPSKNVCM